MFVSRPILGIHAMLLNLVFNFYVYVYFLLKIYNYNYCAIQFPLVYIAWIYDNMFRSGLENHDFFLNKKNRIF